MLELTYASMRPVIWRTLCKNNLDEVLQGGPSSADGPHLQQVLLKLLGGDGPDAQFLCGCINDDESLAIAFCILSEIQKELNTSAEENDTPQRESCKNVEEAVTSDHELQKRNVADEERLCPAAPADVATPVRKRDSGEDLSGLVLSEIPSCGRFPTEFGLCSPLDKYAAGTGRDKKLVDRRLLQMEDITSKIPSSPSGRGGWETDESEPALQQQKRAAERFSVGPYGLMYSPKKTSAEPVSAASTGTNTPARSPKSQHSSLTLALLNLEDDAEEEDGGQASQQRKLGRSRRAPPMSSGAAQQVPKVPAPFEGGGSLAAMSCGKSSSLGISGTKKKKSTSPEDRDSGSSSPPDNEVGERMQRASPSPSIRGSGDRWETGSVASSSAPSPTTSSTTPVPRYTKEALTVVSLIGRGASSMVYKCLYIPTLTLLAVKCISVLDRKRQKQMRSELKALHSLSRGVLPVDPLVRGSFVDLGLGVSNGVAGIVPMIGRGGRPELSAEAGGDGGGIIDPHDHDQEQHDTTDSSLSSGGTMDTEESTVDGDSPSLLRLRTERHRYQKPTVRRLGSVETDTDRKRVSELLEAAALQISEEITPTMGDSFSEAPTPTRKTTVTAAGGGGGKGSVVGFMKDRSCPSTCPPTPYTPVVEDDVPSPYIVTFYDAYTDSDQGAVCLVLEFMGGGSLQDIIDRQVAVAEKKKKASAASSRAIPGSGNRGRDGEGEGEGIEDLREFAVNTDDTDNSSADSVAGKLSPRPTLDDDDVDVECTTGSGGLNHTDELVSSLCSSGKDLAAEEEEEEELAIEGVIEGVAAEFLGSNSTTVEESTLSPSESGGIRKRVTISGGGGGGNNRVATTRASRTSISGDTDTSTASHEETTDTKHLKTGTNKKSPPHDHGYHVDESDIAVVAYSVLRALVTLHRRSILHRDIKPANILCSSAGLVKLSDLGIAREMADLEPAPETFTGTLMYMSPERIMGEPYSFASDIWSLGVSLVALATGKLPYPSVTGYWSMMTAIQEGQVQGLSADKFSLHLRDFIALTVSPSPEKRPSASTLLHHAFIAHAIECGFIPVPEQPHVTKALLGASQAPLRPETVKKTIRSILDWKPAHWKDMVLLTQLQFNYYHGTNSPLFRPFNTGLTATSASTITLYDPFTVPSSGIPPSNSLLSNLASNSNSLSVSSSSSASGSALEQEAGGGGGGGGGGGETPSRSGLLRHVSPGERSRNENDRYEREQQRQQPQQQQQQIQRVLKSQISGVVDTVQNPWTMPVSTKAARYLANQLNVNIVELLCIIRSMQLESTTRGSHPHDTAVAAGAIAADEEEGGGRAGLPPPTGTAGRDRGDRDRGNRRGRRHDDSSQEEEAYQEAAGSGSIYAEEELPLDESLDPHDDFPVQASSQQNKKRAGDQLKNAVSRVEKGAAPLSFPTDAGAGTKPDPPSPPFEGGTSVPTSSEETISIMAADHQKNQNTVGAGALPEGMFANNNPSSSSSDTFTYGDDYSSKPCPQMHLPYSLLETNEDEDDGKKLLEGGEEQEQEVGGKASIAGSTPSTPVVKTEWSYAPREAEMKAAIARNNNPSYMNRSHLSDHENFHFVSVLASRASSTSESSAHGHPRPPASETVELESSCSTPIDGPGDEDDNEDTASVDTNYAPPRHSTAKSDHHYRQIADISGEIDRIVVKSSSSLVPALYPVPLHGGGGSCGMSLYDADDDHEREEKEEVAEEDEAAFDDLRSVAAASGGGSRGGILLGKFTPPPSTARSSRSGGSKSSSTPSSVTMSTIGSTSGSFDGQSRRSSFRIPRISPVPDDDEEASAHISASQPKQDDSTRPRKAVAITMPPTQSSPSNDSTSSDVDDKVVTNLQGVHHSEVNDLIRRHAAEIADMQARQDTELVTTRHQQHQLSRAQSITTSSGSSAAEVATHDSRDYSRLKTEASADAEVTPQDDPQPKGALLTIEVPGRQSPVGSTATVAIDPYVLARQLGLGLGQGLQIDVNLPLPRIDTNSSSDEDSAIGTRQPVAATKHKYYWQGSSNFSSTYSSNAGSPNSAGTGTTVDRQVYTVSAAAPSLVLANKIVTGIAGSGSPPRQDPLVKISPPQSWPSGSITSLPRDEEGVVAAPVLQQGVIRGGGGVKQVPSPATDQEAREPSTRDRTANDLLYLAKVPIPQFCSLRIHVDTSESDEDAGGGSGSVSGAANSDTTSTSTPPPRRGAAVLVLPLHQPPLSNSTAGGVAAWSSTEGCDQYVSQLPSPNTSEISGQSLSEDSSGYADLGRCSPIRSVPKEAAAQYIDDPAAAFSTSTPAPHLPPRSPLPLSLGGGGGSLATSITEVVPSADKSHGPPLPPTYDKGSSKQTGRAAAPPPVPASSGGRGRAGANKSVKKAAAGRGEATVPGLVVMVGPGAVVELSLPLLRLNSHSLSKVGGKSQIRHAPASGSPCSLNSSSRYTASIDTLYASPLSSPSSSRGNSNASSPVFSHMRAAPTPRFSSLFVSSTDSDDDYDVGRNHNSFAYDSHDTSDERLAASHLARRPTLSVLLSSMNDDERRIMSASGEDSALTIGHIKGCAEFDTDHSASPLQKAIMSPAPVPPLLPPTSSSTAGEPDIDSSSSGPGHGPGRVAGTMRGKPPTGRGCKRIPVLSLPIQSFAVPCGKTSRSATPQTQAQAQGLERFKSLNDEPQNLPVGGAPLPAVQQPSRHRHKHTTDSSRCLPRMPAMLRRATKSLRRFFCFHGHHPRHRAAVSRTSSSPYPHPYRDFDDYDTTDIEQHGDEEGKDEDDDGDSGDDADIDQSCRGEVGIDQSSRGEVSEWYEDQTKA